MCSVTTGDRVTEGEAYRLADEISELAAHISAATCRWLLLIAEFDHAEAYTWFGFPTCADWLAWSCGISGSTARQHVRVARALREFGRVRDCFARGELSYSKVRALARIASPENEDYLLMLARHCTAAQLESVVRRYRRCTATALEEANAAHASRHVCWSWDDDGYLNIRGRLTAEEGQVLVQALQAGREALRVHTPTPNGQSDVSAETVTPDATHADALALMAETLLAGGPKHRGRRHVPRSWYTWRRAR